MTRREADLILVVACSLALIVVILAFPFARPARIVLALLFVMFLPGYALTAALFPRKDQIDLVERIALSLGLSIAVVPLIGLALNYSPWGIRLYPALAFVALFIVLAAAAALVRRRMLSADEAFGITVPVRWPGWPRAHMADGLLVLALVPLAAAVGVAGYFVTGARGGAESFTEFYVLGADGTAQSYPSAVRVGESAALTLGVVNHEGKHTRYRIEARVAGEQMSDIDGLLLADGQRWENTISLVPTRVGDNQKVEFLLYEDGGAEPYRAVHLWLDVGGALVRAIPRTEARPSPTPVPSPTATPPAPAATGVLAEEQAPEPPEEAAEASQPPQYQVHVVVGGEYLSAIARGYGVPLNAVIAANDLENPDLIYPGQEILIPAGSAPGEGD
jgi:uncharacterized membrane protein/LysM repeat protein